MSDTNRKNKYQMKIWTSKDLLSKVDKINKEYNSNNGLNQLSGLNRSKIINLCLNLYVNDKEFEKTIKDLIITGE